MNTQVKPNKVVHREDFYYEKTVLVSGSVFCGPKKYDIGERVKRDVPNIHILDILRYHDEPIE